MAQSEARCHIATLRDLLSGRSRGFVDHADFYGGMVARTTSAEATIALATS